MRGDLLDKGFPKLHHVDNCYRRNIPPVPLCFTTEMHSLKNNTTWLRLNNVSRQQILAITSRNEFEKVEMISRRCLYLLSFGMLRGSETGTLFHHVYNSSTMHVSVSTTVLYVSNVCQYGLRVTLTRLRYLTTT